MRTIACNKTIKKRLASLVLTLITAAALALVCGCSSSVPESAVCEIVVRDFGTITVTLDGNSAPITVAHFIKLAETGSYDGSYFTRVQQGFVLQEDVK